MCKANGVTFDEKIFNLILNNNKAEFLAKHGSETLATYVLDLEDFFKNFLTEFKADFSAWVANPTSTPAGDSKPSLTSDLSGLKGKTVAVNTSVFDYNSVRNARRI